MIIVSVKELKNRLTQHLRWVKQGEDLLITERGKPIAVIRPGRPPMNYLDTSALIKRFVAERGSPQVARLVSQSKQTNPQYMFLRSGETSGTIPSWRSRWPDH